MKGIAILMAGLALSTAGLSRVPKKGVFTQDTAAPQGSTAGVQWLKSFDGERTDSLLRDARFRPLVDRCFPDAKVPFWGNEPMVEVIFEFLGVPGVVTVEHHRFVIVAGAVKHFAVDRGLLWVDTHLDEAQADPIMAIVLTDLEGPKTTLCLYSNADFYDNPEMLPHNLLLNIARWIRVPRRPIMQVNRAVLVDPSGLRQKEVPPEALGIPLSRYTPLNEGELTGPGPSLTGSALPSEADARRSSLRFMAWR